MLKSWDATIDGWPVYPMVNQEDRRDSQPSEGVDFASLIYQEGDRIYNFAYRLAGNSSDASDLVQEAFSRAFSARHRYVPGRSFATWVMSILHNIFIDGIRRYDKKHVVSMDAPLSDQERGGWADVLPGRDPDPLESIARKEDGDLVQDALNDLSPDHRVVVVMCDVEHMTYEEIAGVVGCPVGTVRSRLHQGRLLLKKTFEGLRGNGI
jgi:RNA polymerase sigma-70 factor (ECF subfamily)